ncbi:MAG: TrmH family RNA methyltransferase [Acidimicrobiia bacterium]
MAATAGPVGPVVLHDAEDPRLVDYVHLRDGRDRRTVIVEGPTALAELVRSPFRVRSVLVLASRLDRVQALLPAGTVVYVADSAVLRATVGFDLHRGVVASADRAPLRAVEAVLAGTDRLAVLERLNDHENLGALFRNAAAFGIGGFVLDPETADPLYRRSIRVSMGHVLHVPFARAQAWPAAIEQAREHGFTVVALTPGPGTSTIDELAADPPARIALLLGAEGPGLTDAALAAADRRVRIPLAAGVDSLNVATAAAIAFHRLAPA